MLVVFVTKLLRLKLIVLDIACIILTLWPLFVIPVSEFVVNRLNTVKDADHDFVQTAKRNAHKMYKHV